MVSWFGEGSFSNGIEIYFRSGFFIWNETVPAKVSLFVWKAIRNKIPTTENLIKSGVIGQKESVYVLVARKNWNLLHFFF